MEIGDRVHHIVPGTLTVIPPGMRIVYNYTAKRYRHFYVHFGFRKKILSSSAAPICLHLPHAMDELFDRLQNIQQIFTRNPLHAEISFWALLWDVTASAIQGSDNSKEESSLAKAAEELIESTLQGELSAKTLAAKLGFSTAHVNRSIKAKHGLTTIQLIRKRRLQRAYHLLLHSTMPIKLLAAECGIGDLQKFNKLMRHEYGKSPRTLREIHTPDPVWALDRR